MGVDKSVPLGHSYRAIPGRRQVVHKVSKPKDRRRTKSRVRRLDDEEDPEMSGGEEEAWMTSSPGHKTQEK